jgi:hypothetical protein
MMLRLGFSDIGKLAKQGFPVWKSPPVARMGTYVNALIRLLDGWPSEKKNKSILDLMNTNEGNNEQETE